MDCVGDCGFGVEVAAAIAEGIRRYVHDAHDERAAAQFERSGAESPLSRLAGQRCCHGVIERSGVLLSCGRSEVAQSEALQTGTFSGRAERFETG